MKLFMITVLPLSLVYMLTKNHEQSPAAYASALTGLILGAVYAFIECMFTPAYYLIRYAFFPNYGFYLFFEIVLPCLFCTVFYVIFIKKHDKVLFSLYFVFAAFYAVYMPARIMHRHDVLDWYLLFVKPVIYTSMLIGFKHTFYFLGELCSNCGLFQHSGIPVSKDLPKRLFLLAGFTLGLALIPSAVDVMNLLNLPFWTVLSAAFVYCAVSLFGKKILKFI
ncbi:hypothetical protein V1L52_04635 [Treponema sp. HNW]|uniref:hypothetical protein n=1 Tax=Treponema sp. HNW TaxID=3116654 RepID=UPI003D124A4C